MLLNIDGLNISWKKGVPSPFEGELGWHAVGDVEEYAPLIFRRVRNNLAANDIRSFDARRIPVDDFMYGPMVNKVEDDVFPKANNYKVLKLTNKIFRDKLVVSFRK